MSSPDDVTVAWELIKGQPCCCGDKSCSEGWPDKWQWVARTDGASATGDTPEQAEDLLALVQRCRREGRAPTVAELAEIK